MLPSKKYLINIGVAILLLLLQINTIYIEINGISPDFLVVFVVVIALIEGQFTALLTGFLVGILFDFLGNEITGTNALTLMLSGFVAGYFFVEEKSFQESIGIPRFLIALGISSIIRSVIYQVFHISPTDSKDIVYLLTSLLGSTIYTLSFGLILMLIAARKKE
ncbi:MAG: rod shape-determining protein MreD [Chlorobiota bacterium]|nr:MAG: rod shape-determining protein MreD [Chlorobiota bacterium]